VSRAAARARSRRQPSGSCPARRARCCSTAVRSRRFAARRAAARTRGCRWCSRTRSPRSTRAARSARRSPTGSRSRACRAALTRSTRPRCSTRSASPRPRSGATRTSSQAGNASASRFARALAADPSVVVLDEPLSSLDASAQAQAANLLVRLARDRGLALLLISHDLGIVNHVADVVSVMYLGVVVETAPTRALWQAPQHPYTEALVAAIPHADGAGFLPEALPARCPIRLSLRAAAGSILGARTSSTAACLRCRRCTTSALSAPRPASCATPKLDR